MTETPEALRQQLLAKLSAATVVAVIRFQPSRGGEQLGAASKTPWTFPKAAKGVSLETQGASKARGAGRDLSEATADIRFAGSSERLLARHPAGSKNEARPLDTGGLRRSAEGGRRAAASDAHIRARRERMIMTTRKRRSSKHTAECHRNSLRAGGMISCEVTPRDGKCSGAQ